MEFGRVNARTLSNPKLFHMFCCGQLLRRDEYWDHQNYHDKVAHPENSRFVRCQYGCGFGVEKFKPTRGQLKYTHNYLLIWLFRYDSFCDTILHTNLVEVESHKNAEIRISKFMVVLSMADKFLDGATLNALSATCSFIRSNIFDYFPHRYITYTSWTKKRHVDGRVEWIEGGEVGDVCRPLYVVLASEVFESAVSQLADDPKWNVFRWIGETQNWMPIQGPQLQRTNFNEDCCIDGFDGQTS